MNGLFVFMSTVLTSTVFSALISFSFTEAKERWLLRRAKIEEIYVDAAGWMTSVGTYYMPFIMVASGELTYQQAHHDLTKDQAKDTKEIGMHYRKLKMNILMYERSLTPSLENIEALRDKLARLSFAMKRAQSDRPKLAALGKSFKYAMDEFVEGEAAFLSAVVDLGALIGAERGQAQKLADWLNGKVGASRQWLKWCNDQLRKRSS